MFQFPRFPLVFASHTFRCGVAPFGDRRIAGCQPLPGAFRRVATSFLGSRRLGIHPMRVCGVLAPARAGLPVPMGLLRDARGEPQTPGSHRNQTPRRGPFPSSRSCRICGGAAGIRTPDLRRAKAALSQLSYGPRSPLRSPAPSPGVGAPGLEPGTSALSGPRSHHLSYAPASPTIPSLQGNPRGSCLAPTTTVRCAYAPRRCRRRSRSQATHTVVSHPCRRRVQGWHPFHRRTSSRPRALLPDRPPDPVRSRSRSSVPRALGLVSPTPDLGFCPGLFRPIHAGLPCP